MKLVKNYKPTSNRPSPSMTTLLYAEARELLTTWEVLRDKSVIEKRLALCDKKYKAGAERLVRQYMHEIKKYERPV